MNAKSFLALNNAGRLTGARMALHSPGERYTCHHCGSVLVLHTESERPWFMHTDTAFTERGRQGCPYIHTDIDEVLLILQLRPYVPNAMPIIGHGVRHCPLYEYRKAHAYDVMPPRPQQQGGYEVIPGRHQRVWWGLAMYALWMSSGAAPGRQKTPPWFEHE